jgi:hypothetical protein
MLLWMGAPALAQVNSSRQAIPLLGLEGAAAELAAKMLFICGGTGSVRFNLTVKHATPGETLTLSVDGIPRATAPVNTLGTARFVFRNGSTAGSVPPLVFDPRGRTVEVEDASGPVLTNTTSEGGNPPGSRIKERVSLQPTGAIPGASGRARLRERRGVRDFDVEIEDVPDGAYELLVGGTSRGTITVAGGEGDIEFSDGGDDPDELPLDFDPLGALVQVAQGSTIVLSGELLAEAPGVNVCTPSESTALLANVGPDPDAKGDVRFRIKDDCDRDFRVEIEDLPVGAYDLLVGGVVRGTIDVADVGLGETEGQIEFDTDVDEPDELPLDFDPVGQTVEIFQGGTLFLSSTVGDPGPGTCDPMDVEPEMANTGADPDAHGKARFRQEIDCDRDFRVEVDDLAVGSYELVVGGVVRGTIDVVDVGAGDTEGDIDFDNDPDQPGEILLDFDPRGELVDVRQGATVFLSVTMPD